MDERLSGFTLQPLAASRRAEAFDLVTEVFVHGSTLHKALSLDLATYRADLRPSYEAMVAQGLSFVALDDTGRILGAIIATDLLDTLSDTPAETAVSALTQSLTQAYLSHRPIGAGKALLVDMAAVHPDARGQGVYPALRGALHEAARENGWRYVVGELSSVATQAVVLGKMGHSKIAEIAFSDFEWNGARPFAAITSPPSIILAEGRL